MSDINVQTLARELLSAYEAGQMVEATPSARFPGFSIDDAYAVESEIRRMREAGGHRALGRKVGYANKAVWRVLKLDTLVWAHMYDDTVQYAQGNLASISLPHARSLKIEPEVVIGLKAANTDAPDAAAALAAVDWLAIGFEIIDCPYPGWQFQPADFVASLGLHAGLVVGERVPVDAASASKLLEDLSRFRVRILKHGEFVEEGSGRNSLRSPALCLAELAGAIVKRGDTPLQAGEIISSGTLTAGHPTQAGDLWTVQVEGIELPSLTARLE